MTSQLYGVGLTEHEIDDLIHVLEWQDLTRMSANRASAILCRVRGVSRDIVNRSIDEEMRRLYEE